MFNRFDPTRQTAARQASTPTTPSIEDRPGPGQPGTLGDQLLLVDVWLTTDLRKRRENPRWVWEACRALVLAHCGSPWSV